MIDQTGSMPSVVLVARHAEREDYQWKARGQSWQAQAARPWDTPLTPAGHAQGQALGRAIGRHLSRLSLPSVSRIFCSPLLRCAQTAAAAAVELGVPALCVDPSLSETICEHWYRSWGVPGANSSWGGHPGSETGRPVDLAQLHPGCLGPASALHNSPELLAAELDAEVTREGGSVTRPDGGRVTVDLGYEPTWAADEYTWGKFETHAMLEERMGRFLNHLATQHPEQAVLCLSHGGPTSYSCAALCPELKAPLCGYTGLFVYVKDEHGQWSALLAGDQSHLDELTEGSLDGASSVAEQAPGK